MMIRIITDLKDRKKTMINLSPNIKRMTKEAINFKKERSFGELIGVPFQFLFQEFKQIFLTALKYAGPFLFTAAVLLVISFNNFWLEVNKV